MSKLSNLFLIFALLAALLGGAVTYTPARAAGVLYVKPVAAGSGNCSSWANACTLQTALAAAVPGDQIWVQAGTHVPDNISDRSFSFHLKDGVAIYGGFTGTETQLTQRDPTTNVTILSGDLNGDDSGFTNNGENLYHVVRSEENSSSAILDGFTIRGGNANGDTFPSDSGGGMLNETSPTLRNLTFSGNYASNGGALYNNGNPTLTSVLFSANHASISGGALYNKGNLTFTGGLVLENSATEGGGMYNSGGSSALAHITFSGNSAEEGGGGMLNSGGSPTLTNVSFFSNSALFGGGMRNLGGNLTLTNVIIAANSAIEDGGGMYNDGGNTTLTNAIISENTAHLGGGMHNGQTSPTLTNVTFANNSADSGGGGMVNALGNPVLTNVTFSGNSVFNVGGGVYNFGGSPTLTNVTFSNNSASTAGGGLYNANGSNPTLINTLIANSPSGGDCVNVSSTLGLASSYNLIEDASKACGLANGANGNITGIDPKLGPLTENGGFAQTHALLAGSSAINAGTNVYCPPKDQRGLTRPQPQGGKCDIGAYEARILTISGSAGAAGVPLSYPDGTLKKVISLSNGSYSIPILEGWSGTVTPSHPCFVFTPVNRSYINLSANQTAQNYSAIFNPASGCARIEVKFGQTSQGTYGVPKNAGTRLSFPVDSGPVFVNGTNNVPFVASERIQSPKTGTLAHFSEMMGLPANLKSTKYAFPAYDNVTFDSQLRFGNLNTNSTATVRLFIGGSEMTSGCTPSNSPFTLGPRASLRVKCAQNNGPVRIESNVNIIAALRVLLPKSSTNPTSFSEIMGVPQSQWGSSYIFPWYNNVELNTQLRVANVGSNTTTVKVMIGQQDVTGACTSSNPNNSFTLGRNKSMRVSCNVNNGPLKVSSSGGIPIVASLRVAFNTGGTWTSFSEMMGLPESQLHSGYVFPWYNNLELNSQLRFANLSNSTAKVHVFIAGHEMTSGCTPSNSPFTLAAGASIRVRCNVNNGPVVIRSEGGQKIIAALRVQFPKTGTPVTSFSELMGLPENQLTTSYIFPWYNNLQLNTQIRLGVP